MLMIRRKATFCVYECVLEVSGRSAWKFLGPLDLNKGVEQEGHCNDGDEHAQDLYLEHQAPPWRDALAIGAAVSVVLKSMPAFLAADEFHPPT